MFEMKNIPDGINTRLDTAKENINNMDNMGIDAIQNERQKKKEKKIENQ